MLNMTVVYVVFGAVLCALVGAVAAGATRGNSVAGFVLGLLLGPPGILIALLLGPMAEPSDPQRR